MLEQAAGLTDPTKRADIYKQVQQRVLKDLVVVPLVDTLTYDAKRAEVTAKRWTRWRRTCGCTTCRSRSDGRAPEAAAIAGAGSVTHVLTYITQRLLQAIPVLLGISVLSLSHAPPDPGRPGGGLRWR